MSKNQAFWTNWHKNNLQVILTTTSGITGAILGIYRSYRGPLLVPKMETKLTPEASKTQPKKQAVFVSRFWVFLVTFWLPKWSFLEDILIQKLIFYTKGEPCYSTAPATQIQGSGPSKRDEIMSKILIFADFETIYVFNKCL